jgi:hypothetical protein
MRKTEEGKVEILKYYAKATQNKVLAYTTLQK